MEKTAEKVTYTVDLTPLNESVDRICELVDTLRAERAELVEALDRLTGAVMSEQRTFSVAEQAAFDAAVAVLAKAR